MVVRGSFSVDARIARTRASAPALVLRAYWKGAQALWNVKLLRERATLPRPASRPYSGWTAAPPPHTEPGPRNSWLFVPLIHAGAGLLSHAAQRTWSAVRVGGARFDEIAAALRESAPQQPALLLRALPTCEARDDALSAHNPCDLAMAAELEALPAARLPLAAAVSLHGSRLALAQSALLQTYGGVCVATAAQSLADVARTLLHRPEPLEAPARSRHSAPHDAD